MSTFPGGPAVVGGCRWRPPPAASRGHVAVKPVQVPVRSPGARAGGSRRLERSPRLDRGCAFFCRRTLHASHRPESAQNRRCREEKFGLGPDRFRGSGSVPSPSRRRITETARFGAKTRDKTRKRDFSVIVKFVCLFVCCCAGPHGCWKQPHCGFTEIKHATSGSRDRASLRETDAGFRNQKILENES